MNSTQKTKHISLHDELLHKYASKCVCDVCGTNRYEIDLYCAESSDPVCCDMSEIFDMETGYKES